MRIAAVLIAHDVEAWVEQALRSVLHQAETLQHVVVVENGSTDATLEVVQRTVASARLGGQVTLVSEPALGPGGARNLGARIALERGADALAFLDGDDWWEPSFVDCVAGVLRTDPLRAAAFGWSIVRHADGRFRGVRARLRRDYRYEDLCWHKSPMVTTSSLIVRASDFQRVGGFDAGLPSSEDWELLLRLARGGSRVGCARRWVVNYRKRPGQRTADLGATLEGLQKVALAHPATLRAKHWWWPMVEALNAGDVARHDEVRELRPAVSAADFASPQFFRYVLARLRNRLRPGV